MKTSVFLAFSLVSIWTSLVGVSLYSLDAHLHYRELGWAVSIGLILLITHMVNMTLYFKIRGDEPFKWHKYKTIGAKI